VPVIVLTLFLRLVCKLVELLEQAGESNNVRHTEQAQGSRDVLHTSTISYRTRDDSGDYDFRIEHRLDSTIRVYITGYPSEEAERSAPHRLTDMGRSYICWSKPIRSEEAALAVAAQWADNVQRYLKTGQGF